MIAKIIDGKMVADATLRSITDEVRDIEIKLGRKPKLAVVLVGENPASKIYVASKSKKAKQCGIAVVDLKFPSDISNKNLQNQLSQLSKDSSLDGILLQLPLPRDLEEFDAIMCIDPLLDVDGLHPKNQGLLLRGERTFVPCTPLGAILLIEEGRRMLAQSNNLQGLHAVVVGRSILVGKPMAMLLLARNCTVEICHSKTKNLNEELKRADIVVAAVGNPELISGKDIKPGAIVIDVGINRTVDGSLLGDVQFASAIAVAGAITPVPGGVGPMTIAMLLKNTVDSARWKLK